MLTSDTDVYTPPPKKKIIIKKSGVLHPKITFTHPLVFLKLILKFKSAA